MSYRFSAITTEDVRNPSVCIYDNGVVRNIENQFDLIKHTPIYVDICSEYSESGDEIEEKIIRKGTMARCTKICAII